MSNPSRQPAKSYEDLEIWQRSHAVVLKVYEITATLPKHELYGLTSQMRRAAVSIAANIAEGFRKSGINDKANFLLMSLASADELDYYLLLVKDLAYLKDVDGIRTELKSISRMIDAYRRAIKSGAKASSASSAENPEFVTGLD